MAWLELWRVGDGLSSLVPIPVLRLQERSQSPMLVMWKTLEATRLPSKVMVEMSLNLHHMLLRMMMPEV